MPIVGVGKLERGNQRSVSANQAIPCRLVHETSGAFQDCAIAVRFVSEKGVDPLPMDICRPLGLKDIVNGQLQKNIPHRCGIENVGV